MIGTSAIVGIIYSCGVLGLIWAVINWFSVKSIQLTVEATDEGVEAKLNQEDNMAKKIETMTQIGEYISRGANAFLVQEYRICLIFIAVMGVIIKLTIDTNISWGNFSTSIAFWTGALTSIISGFIGMRVAVFSNYRTAYKAQFSLADAFKVAFRAGCVMGFALSSLSLLVLNTLILIYRASYSIEPQDNPTENCPKPFEYSTCPQSGDELITNIYESIAGYGLGGSTIALFGRVGGGIYTKAADVGADLVGKVEQDLPEDSPRNPATIADNVGDNVGDIAGMGSDLFGSFAESTCAALVILASSNQQRFYTSQFQCSDSLSDFTKVAWCSDADAFLFYPLLLSSLSIVACILCAVFATNIMSVNQTDQIEKTLRYQLIISAAFLAVALLVAGYLGLSAPDNAYQMLPTGLASKVNNLILPVESGYPLGVTGGDYYDLTPFNSYICCLSGLVVGLLIGILTEYYTSNAYKPVQEVSESCKTGAATNIIYGLALGYLSCVIPVILLGIAAYISHKTLGLFGIALAALGMLSNLAVSLAVDAYGPISDNAGGIAEMSELGEETRHRTDALDAAGNTTAAIGKGFAIGSAAFVSLALYGAFITRSKTNPYNVEKTDAFVIDHVEVTDALLFSGLLIGAMLPYAFSAMTMKSVGKAALEMVFEIRKQLTENPKIRTGEQLPDYEKCVAISTSASLREMVGPGALVIVTPLLIGLVFGPRAVAGLLPGILVSGVQMAISSSNTGGAWDNAKKYIEAGKLKDGDVIKKKGSDEHKAAVIGDTVGDPLKDTSGPSLNILVKLSAILSLVFAPFFQTTGWLVCTLDENTDPPGYRTCD